MGDLIDIELKVVQLVVSYEFGFKVDIFFGYDYEICEKYGQIKCGFIFCYVQFMVIGGFIGMGFFVGIGGVLVKVGFLFVFFGYFFWGFFFIWLCNLCVVEMCFYFFICGLIFEFVSCYVDFVLGFVMGWIYFYVGVMLVCVEYSVVVIIMQYWIIDVNFVVWIVMVMVICVLLNIVVVK